MGPEMLDGALQRLGEAHRPREREPPGMLEDAAHPGALREASRPLHA